MVNRARGLETTEDLASAFDHHVRVAGRRQRNPVNLGAGMVRELEFHPTRDWRFDRSWPELMLAAELEGISRGKKSRHTEARGYEADCEKYNAALELGWSVLRFTPSMVYTGGFVAQLERVVLERRRRIEGIGTDPALTLNFDLNRRH